ncbi:MAG: PAS domain-containing protein [Bacteroidetes bacterium]|nr:PAS domain-containing protein [Bacteroidota bacterium]
MDNNDSIKLDFEQARAKHILFKSRLRSILYGIDLDQTPVLSHYECNVGKWIYNHALRAYGHLPDMVELEKVHAEIHASARHLVALYKEGKVEAARLGLQDMEKVADKLVELLTTLETKIAENPTDSVDSKENRYLEIKLNEFQDILKSNIELDQRIKEQVQQAASATERFNLLAKATQDVIWDWDLEKGTLWWNDNFQKQFLYEKEEIENGLDSWINRLHEVDKDRVVKSIQNAIDTGKDLWSEEYRFKKGDGTYAYIFDRGYIIHDGEGKPLRMIGSMLDITLRKIAESEVAEARSVAEKSAEQLELLVKERTRELQRSNEDLQQFAHVASHDLKEPVRKIKTFLNIIQSEYGNLLPAQAQNYMMKLHRSADRVKSMIEGVLKYSSLDSPELDSVEKIDLNTVFKNVLNDLDLVIQEKHASIEILKMPAIEGFPTLIYQLFYNLINNALKFSKKDVRPVIKVSSEIIDNRYVRIVLEDNGIGFDESQAKKIFGTFMRLHPKDQYDGTGLGLALCKKIVERHRGEIVAKGINNVGAVFVVSLPLTQSSIRPQNMN